MTEQEINLKILEACGWFKKKTWFSDTDIRMWWHKDREHAREVCPDFYNDLNAMHEAEQWLFNSNPGYWNRSYPIEKENPQVDWTALLSVLTTPGIHRFHVMENVSLFQG